MLPQNDLDYLADRAPGHTITPEGGATCVLIPGLPLGPGFRADQADLLLRLAAGYPDVPPDMWWFSPAVHRVDGVEIPATQVTEVFFGRQWQRWSRHLTAGQWRSGIDSLETFMAVVRREITRSAPQAAA